MKFPTFNLVFTVFLFWLTIQLKGKYEEYLAYIFILTVGILHGSNDISLLSLVTKTKGSKLRYLLFYVGLVITTVIAFIKLPMLALLIFVMVSCYHFGEQHFHHQLTAQNKTAQALYMCYGMLVFGLLFYFNADTTSIIIEELINYRLTKNNYQYLLIVGIVSTIIFTFFNQKNFKTTPNYFQEIFVILLFALLFKLASLLWAFAIYFVVWHSIPSLMDQIKALYGESSKPNLIQYIKSSILYWFISILGLVLLYFGTTYFEVRFVTIFFAFLAAITIPHVVVMYFLYKK